MRSALLCVVLLLGSSCGALSAGAPKASGSPLTPSGSGTPPNCAAIIDYADFVRHDGIFYSAAYSSLGRSITTGDLGPERFRIKNTISMTNCDPHHQPVDGDAAYVPTGEPVFAVKGYAPTFRVAARHDNMLVLYEADSNPAARRGADLLDIEGRVKSIALLDQKTGRIAVSRLTDKSRVESLVRAIAGASIDPSYPPQTSGPVDYVQLAFELDDGTTTVRAYDRTRGVVWRGIQVGTAFSSAVDQLVRTAPTPSPVPATMNLARRYDLGRATGVSLKDLAAQGTFRPVPALSAFLAILDAELPARRATRPSGGYVVVIFSFADTFVSFAYQESSETLTVVLPDDELAVQVPATFRALIR
ncbi:MAG TPA: hypothetical protein VGR85_02875 [Candidatus Limnocylindria bacterium]|nr:hypothetical protein [Candidatus Limnocylindria bacterium]